MIGTYSSLYALGVIGGNGIWALRKELEAQALWNHDIATGNLAEAR